ncbi:S-layer homology domain-containing protein [Phormidium sp. FACHB-322]|nr:S-layer homology domain-containing protein [Phormidium sp. FACHB-77]MBD2028466.1 S-layer homology domain-containing protein [Phormidium sp. FACHB-322]MBD2053604.1 S-layer homology domain-containing protein [Leptolyngbya sp. FACHB-60]
MSAQTPVPAQVPAPIPAPSTSFRDVPADYWAYEYISGLARFSVISGFPDGTFQPNEPVTRAQFAAILNQAFMSAQPFQVPNERLNATQPSTPTFADVPNNHWAAGYIAKARTAGFLSGYPGNQFRPNQPIPRVQALISIANGLGYQGGSMADLSAYKDAAAIPAYARPGITAARAANIVVNYPALDQLLPNRPATRAEVAAFVYQALVKDGRAQPVAAAGARWNKAPITTLPTAAAGFSFSADGQRLLALTTDGATLQIWNTQTGALIKEITAGEQTRFDGAAISKDGTKVAAIAQTSPTNTVELAAWTIETGQPLWKKTISQATSTIDGGQIAFSSDNQRIITFVNPDQDGTSAPQLALWNTANGAAVQSLDTSGRFAISPNGQFLAIQLYSNDSSGRVDLWRLNQSGMFEYARTLPPEDILFWGMNIVFRNDGLLNVLTRSPGDGLLVTWDPQTGARVTSTGLPADRSDDAIGLSPDGDSYFFAGPVAGARLGSVRTGEVQDWPHGYRVAFSDRGNYLALMNNNPNEVGSALPTLSISIYSKTAH